MPGRGNRQEEENAGEEMKLTPSPPLPTDCEVQKQRQSDHNDGEQSLGEHGERHARVAAVPAPGIAVFQRGGEKIEGQSDEKTKNGLRNQNPGEKVAARRRGDE